MLCLGLLAVACDLKVDSYETKAPAGRRSRGKKGGGKSGGFDDDPAVVQAVAELEREEALHLRLIGASEPADGRSPAAVREAVLRRGGGRIAAGRVHVASGDAGESGVRFEFFVPAEASPPGEAPTGEAPTGETPPPDAVQ